MQVKPGDTVTIHGLTGRPELNGQSAVLVGPAADGRITVRLQSGNEIALKQQNLGIEAPGGGGGGGGGMPGFGGGMPGFGGGMPGFGGGMPGGMPGMPPGGLPAMAEQFAAALQQRLAAAGIRLPPGISPAQAAVGVAIIGAMSLYMLSRFISLTVVGLVGLAAYWGTQTDSGRAMLARGSARVSAALGRPLPPNAALVVLCLAVAMMGHMLLSGRAATGSMGSAGTASASARDTAVASAIREAYEQGYDDGVAGAQKRPPKHIPSPDYFQDSSGGSQVQGSTSRFGFGSVMKYGMAAYFIYNCGKTPGGWDPRLAMANLRANPMQAVMMLVMFSGVLF